MTTPVCPYCGAPAEHVKGIVIYPHRPDLFTLSFWRCEPCQAYVGCHKTGDGMVPLGRLANARLRNLKSIAHAAFDTLWQKALEARRMPSGQFPKGAKGEARNLWYRRLAAALEIPIEECHIGLFDELRCQRAINLCRQWANER